MMMKHLTSKTIASVCLVFSALVPPFIHASEVIFDDPEFRKLIPSFQWTPSPFIPQSFLDSDQKFEKKTERRKRQKSFNFAKNNIGILALVDLLAD